MMDKKEKRILVLDLETTGLYFERDCIVEVGIVSLDKDGKILPVFSSLCREKGFEIDPDAWIFHNSDMCYEEVMKSPFLSEIREELQEILLSFPCTAYNQPFDFGFLESRDFEINKYWLDPMIVLTDIIQIHRYWGYKWPSVQEAWDYLFPEKPYCEGHRALDDAIHEAKIIKKTMELIKYDL